MKRYKDAIDAFNKALSLNSKIPIVWTDLGIAYEAINDKDSAIKCYRKALEINPNFQEAINRLNNLLDSSKVK